MTATFYVGDAIQTMNRLPEKSVDLILTSPPFLALRSYLPQDHPDKALEGGSQSTPGEYVDWLLDVVEACARVLAPHGSLVFELGDTYSGSGGGGGDYLEGGWREGQAQFAGSAASMKESNAAHWRQKNAVKDAWPLSKSLSLIPETFRFATVYGRNPHTGRQTEPWRLRNVIRWVRPNPPVGALGDKFRPATSELMVFCKTKDRYFDLDAVRETPWSDTVGWPSLKVRKDSGYQRKPSEFSKQKEERSGGNPAGAPPLDWWNIPPGGFSGAHYAVWPPELLIKPIKAMCPEKVCRTCGEPSRRIVGDTEYVSAQTQFGERKIRRAAGSGRNGDTGQYGVSTAPTLGWTDCSHDDYRPGTVLDPFGGSGTTALVATGHGRDCTLIDLDERNYDLALDRVGPFILTRGEVAA